MKTASDIPNIEIIYNLKFEKNNFFFLKKISLIAKVIPNAKIPALLKQEILKINKLKN